MSKSNMVHFIASDAHGVKNRPPLLSAARDAAAKIIGADAAARLVNANPQAVLSNQPNRRNHHAMIACLRRFRAENVLLETLYRWTRIEERARSSTG